MLIPRKKNIKSWDGGNGWVGWVRLAGPWAETWAFPIKYENK